jgi:hypothetical protein
MLEWEVEEEAVPRAARQALKVWYAHNRNFDPVRLLA